MRKFQFKLETLLKHRAQVERQKQQELARVQVRMNSIQTALEASESSIRDAASGGMDVHQQRFLSAMRSKMMSLKRELVECNKLREAARAAFTTAAKDRKAIELLREREFAEWRRQQAKREQHAADEATASRSRTTGF